MLNSCLVDTGAPCFVATSLLLDLLQPQFVHLQNDIKMQLLFSVVKAKPDGILSWSVWTSKTECPK